MWRQYAAIGFVELLGGKVACVSCWDRNDKKSYTYSHKDGVDGRFLLSITDQYGTIDKQKADGCWLSCRRWRRMDFKGCGCTPSSCIEEPVNAETVKKISSRVKIVAEGANGPDHARR